MKNIESKFEVIKKAETSIFLLSYVNNIKTNKKELILQSRAGKNYAEHSSVEILDDEGKLISCQDINDDIADFVFENFKVRGDTESFKIYKSDLLKKKFNKYRAKEIRPDDVRHSPTKTEDNFTSNGSKLWYHKPIFEKLRDTGYGSIIRATMTNHQVCASRCQFCSTISRNKKDAISLREAIDFVDKLYYEQAGYNRDNFPQYNESYKKATGSDIRLRGLILSGGGQPNLWPHFSEFVEYLSSLDIDLGLITNGFPKHVSDDVYRHFNWVRISVTPEDASPFYPDSRFDKQYIPHTICHNDEITVGYSYVFGPWTNDDVLNRIGESIDTNGFDYCRTLTDCNLTRNMQLLAHRELADRLYKLNFIDKDGNPNGKIFHQLKYHGTADEADMLWESGQCYVQAYNVFWDTTGHEDNGFSSCYACDSVTVLTDDNDGKVSISERKFNHEKWGTVNNTDVSRLFSEKLNPFFDPRKVCSSCLFMKNNQMVKKMTYMKEGVKPPSDVFSQKHLNFP